nr:Hok/Gef family protein [uncultured Moellerella sp.]
MTKYALVGLITVCVTVLGFTLLMNDRLCLININSGNTVVQAKLSYE